jgi:MoaE-MoaD fusion protein
VNQFRVLLFARYAEEFGGEVVNVILPTGARVSDLVAALRELPGGGSLPAEPFVAMDHRRVAMDTALTPAAELALLPPLAGG